MLATTGKDAPESAAVLEAICLADWIPLYADVRRCGQAPHDAQDLTQEFFCRQLKKNGSMPPTATRVNCGRSCSSHKKIS